ncbi:sigma-54-dependent Fis family transcriptional regulator [Spirochaeta thermophila]|nr:sigma-54-dependent Fis family transcriptional regulator [Spirochaeta thermophila]
MKGGSEDFFRLLLPEDVSMVLLDETAVKVRLGDERPDAVILVHGAGDEWQGIARTLVDVCPHIPLVLCSPDPSPHTVVRGMDLGAVDYLPFPPEREALHRALQRALRCKGYSSSGVGDRSPLERLVGKSESIVKIREYVPLVARVKETVLIQGATGTGKELVARILHDLSPRREMPFVAVNCGALPPSLIEAELFGTEEGAYTDARRRPGLFEQADNGTLFLDEVGELPADLQVKFLRVLEEGRVVRVGGHRSIRVDVRVVCATHRDLAGEVKRGRFRADLFYRINVLKISIPPLTDRKEDIPLLASYFTRMLADQYGCSPRISSGAMDRLLSYDWPGNVRELKNVLTRAVLEARFRGLEMITPDLVRFE